ncbi:MAG: hypothetical protein LBF37_00310, partial [Rickettsiales bacterium]|nr:hypothetical protein [Rickettsiales bacterium]
MSAKKTANLAEIEKQRQLLLYGQYNSLFNDLTLNLPYRFFAYSKPESQNPLFQDLFKKLTDAQTKFHGHDTWTFDSVIGIIAPKFQVTTREATLHFLTKTCRIPEGHINFSRKEAVPGYLFPTRNLHLSRYAMMRVVSTLLDRSNSFQSDISQELLVEPTKTNLDKSKEDFQSEMRLIFADYFFSHPYADCEELVYNTWMRVRGESLRGEYSKAMENLRLVIMRYMKYNIDQASIDREIEYHKQRFYVNEVTDTQRKAIADKLQEYFTETSAEQLKQKFIFDTLFQGFAKKTFKEEYHQFLENNGFQRVKNPKTGRLEWNNRRITAPANPSSHLCPDKTFLLIWTVNKFCDFAKSEHKRTSPKDKNKWFENLISKFFNTLREGLIAVNVEKSKYGFDFMHSPKFTNQHQYKEAFKTVKQVRNGDGRTKLDKESGEKIKEIPGTIDFWKSVTLFSKDDKFCHLRRLGYQQKLRGLHTEYSHEPSLELAKKISKIEAEILFENQALYGDNFQAYVNEPVTLNANGEFVERKILGPNKVVTEFNLPLIKQGTLNPKAKQLDIFQAQVPYDIKPAKIEIAPAVQTAAKKNVKPAQPVRQFERIDFKKIDAHFTSQTLISFLERFLKGGRLHGKEYKRSSLYPEDAEAGDSFSYNIVNGKFADFATGQSGQGVISLVMHAKNLNRNDNKDLIEAAKFLSDWDGGFFATETYTPTPAPIVQKQKSGYLVPPAGTPAPEQIWYIDQYYNIDQKWAYHDKNGRPIMYDCRLNLPDGKKVVLPMKWDKFGDKLIWKTGAIADNRPLYNLHMIQDYEIICISEGAKTADAVSCYIKDALSMT